MYAKETYNQWASEGRKSQLEGRLETHREMSGKEILNFSLNSVYKIPLSHFCGTLEKNNKTKIWHKNSRLVRRIVIKAKIKCSFVFFFAGDTIFTAYTVNYV